MKLREWLWCRRYLAAYLVVVCWVALRVGAFYSPTTGFTSLVLFGDRFAPQRIAPLHDIPIYTLADSDGYDGQFYAELAVAGNPVAAQLELALDAPAYRARRLLLPLLAHVVGFGRPAWVLNAYALSNLFCWLVLAWALALWWFPPTGWHNLIRWVGTLLGSGMVLSVTRSLTDGPTLLGIALGARCVEINRRWPGALIFAATGFVRETGVLGATALWPDDAWRDRRGWLMGAIAMAGCALPAFIWAGFLLVRHHGHVEGGQALALPFTGFARKLVDVAAIWRAKGFVPQIRDEVWGVVALPVQVVFLISRPRPNLIWWRIGAAFALLWVFLAWPGWEGTPSAVTRYVLPLTLAFNVLVPPTRFGLVLLLAGNLTVLSAPTLIAGVPSEQTTFTEGVTCSYAQGWHGRESLEWHTWRWAQPSATLKFQNPSPRAVLVTVEFEISSVTTRTVVARTTDTKQSIALEAGRRIPVRLGPFTLPFGSSDVHFETEEPPFVEPGPAHRRLAFSVHNLRATVSPVLAPVP